jgi:hypothetical protein
MRFPWSIVLALLAVPASVRSAPSASPAAATNHWSFLPPRRTAPPSVSLDGQPIVHPIDAFIAARLAEQKLKPSREADRATLIRRACLDLTGLPPTPAEADAFVADLSPGAYERLVERLLASPHYGERWGRSWLDAARYADSNGYSIDALRSMWPYRDWVVASLNRDLPFDEFTVMQLAGDLLVKNPADSPPSDPAPLIASGFHRNTQINHEGGIDTEQFRIESAMDRVNTTSTVWLGLTLSCAQCHDHKYDPLPMRDYYGLLAFFNQQDNDGHGADNGPQIELPTPGETAALARWQMEVRTLESQIGLEADDSEKHKDLEKKLAELRKKKPPVTTSLVMRERTEPRENVIFVKGDFTRRGDRVVPHTPGVLPPLTTRVGPTRLDLARWLVSPENPLTARVIMNRVWQQYFGKGLVETDNDFGTQGTPPSHPELLDWLATEFMARGWSLKAMHRLIVTSGTYRQSSAISNLKSQISNSLDSGNRWLARQNRFRLDAELIRDVALHASGLLDERLGGPPVFPPQPEGLGAFTQNQREWKTSSGGDRFRRAFYTHLQRTTLHPALAVFDTADTFSTCTRRLRSNTPLQALTLLNDRAFAEFASALARAMQADAAGDHGRIAHAFRRCVTRPPTAVELDRLLALLESERAAGVPEAGAWETVARVLLNLDETISRE